MQVRSAAKCLLVVCLREQQDSYLASVGFVTGWLFVWYMVQVVVLKPGP